MFTSQSVTVSAVCHFADCFQWRLTWGTGWDRVEGRERQSQPPHHPLHLSVVEEPRVLQPAGPLVLDAPDGSVGELSGPSLGPSAARCVPESLHSHIPPAQVTKQNKTQHVPIQVTGVRQDSMLRYTFTVVLNSLICQTFSDVLRTV